MKSRLDEIKANHEFRKGEGWELTILSEEIDWLIEQAEMAEKQHFEILALEANLNGNDKIIEGQQKGIDSLTLDKGYLLEENKALKEHRDNLNSIIFDLEKEINQLKDSANEVINAKDIIIRRLNKEIEEYKKALDIYVEKDIENPHKEVFTDIQGKELI